MLKSTVAATAAAHTKRIRAWAAYEAAKNKAISLTRKTDFIFEKEYNAIVAGNPEAEQAAIVERATAEAQAKQAQKEAAELRKAAEQATSEWGSISYDGFVNRMNNQRR